MKIGGAIELLREGKKVARRGWNGKGMWLKFCNTQCFGDERQADSLGLTYADTPTFLPFIGIRTVENGFIPWVSSQADILADDWMEIY